MKKIFTMTTAPVLYITNAFRICRPNRISMELPETEICHKW